MEPLKEMFNDIYYKKLVKAVSEVYVRVDKKRLYQDFVLGLASRSLNERMRHTTIMMRKHLPSGYTSTLRLLDEIIPQMDPGYTSLVFPDFVAMYGLDHIPLSLKALKNYTRFGSSEFAVRTFLKKDLAQTLGVMEDWSLDPDHHVRRLASEGSRPRLPWSFKLDAIIKDPSLTTPILTNLKTDEEIYVRKSVANHLNDISKENPDYMLSLISGWDLQHEHTSWIIKHASRTLIKKGHPRALTLFGAKTGAGVVIKNFKISPARIKLGGSIELSFSVVSTSKISQKIILDYIVHYVKKGGLTSPKVFKLKEFNLKAQEELVLSKKLKLVDYTTRIHYQGTHTIELQINGKVFRGGDFLLV